MSSFEPIRTDLEFNVPTGEVKANLAEIKRIYAQTTGAISDEALRLTAAQDRLNASLARTGGDTAGARRAALAYRRELQAVAADAERASAAQIRAADRAAAAQLRAAQTVGHALTRYVAAPTALIAFEATKMGVQFDRQMLLVQTQAGASAAEVAKLHDQVLQLARVAPQGPDELAKGLYHLESLGLRGAQAMNVLRTSSTAAFMGVADLESVTTALGGAVVTGIKGTENFDRAMGTLNATIGAGNMRMDDLVAALGTGLLPAAKNAGLSLDQVGAALAVLTDRGMGADEAATRLRMTFALMQAPSGPAKKALADLGIGAGQLGHLLTQPNGLLKALDLLHDKMQTAGRERGARDIIQAFGGGRTSSGILTLIQSLDAGLSSYQTKLEDVRRITDKFFNDQHDVKNSDAYKLAAAWSSIQVDLIELGKTTTPIVVGLARGLQGVADAFDALPGPVKKDVELIVGLLAVGGPLLLAAVAAKKGIASIGDAFLTIPSKGAVAAASAEAELAAIGGAATTANAEVVAVRRSLLGLNGLTIAPIVIPIELHMIKQERDWLNQHAGLLKGPAKALLDIATASVGGNVITDLTGIGATHKSSEEPVGDIVNDSTITGGAGKHAALFSRGSSTGSADATSTGGTGTAPPVPGYQPSRATRLNLALARNPDDRAAIEAKLAYDREAAAFAENRIASGRGSKGLEQSLEHVYAEIAALEGQLQSQRQDAAQKAADKARKRADAAKKARDKLTQQRDQRIQQLTQIPVDLQIAEARAELAHAGEAKLRAIYERQEKEVEAQLRTLKKMHASKDAQLQAIQTLVGIQQKIDGLQSSTSSNADRAGSAREAIATIDEIIAGQSNYQIRGASGAATAVLERIHTRLVQSENHLLNIRGAIARQSPLSPEMDARMRAHGAAFV